MSETYSVIMTGTIADGFELEQVRASVSKLFKLTPQQLDKLFSGRPVAVRRNVDKTLALKLGSALTRAGALTEIKNSVPPGDNGLPAAADTAPSASAEVKAPPVTNTVVADLSGQDLQAQDASGKNTSVIQEEVKPVAVEIVTADSADAEKAVVASLPAEPEAEQIRCPRCGHEQAFDTACGMCKMDLTLHIQRLQRKERARIRRLQSQSAQ